MSKWKWFDWIWGGPTVPFIKPKRGRPARTPFENLERRVGMLVKVITEHDNRISDLEGQKKADKPKEQGDGE